MADPSTPSAPIDVLHGLAKSGASLIVAETTDLDWIDVLAQRLAERLDGSSFRWSLASGLVPLCLKSIGNAQLRKPQEVIDHLKARQGNSVVVMTDIAFALDDDYTRSALRDLARSGSDSGSIFLLPAFGASLPADIRPYSVSFDPGLPNREQLREVLIEEANLWGQRNQRRVSATNAAIDAVVQNVLGLTRSEARRLIRVALANGTIDDNDLPGILKGKHELLSQAGTLSFEPHSEKMSNVAGMANLKQWLEKRRIPFVAEKPPMGLDRPKGMLLLGVQGGGKSVAAKAVAGSWGVPLLKLDMGALYNKFHGETERNLRESLRAADIMSPCVLWIDEIEKGLATDESDGLSRRVLGTLLTWMAERRTAVFLVATANDISQLPPELMRKGRFDEIFFVDLPTPEVRAEIFSIHLRKREFEVERFDVKKLAQASEGFAGAEIEQAVVSAAYTAVAAEGELTTDVILQAIRSTKPLSVVRAADIAGLRAWAASRTVPAEAVSSGATSGENE